MTKFSVQDIFKLYGPEYILKHKLSYEQWKVFNAIIKCKTLILGTHTITCNDCGETYTAFNSCRNRHCPNCQSYAREKWIQKECSSFIDSTYFHIVTTVPAELNEIFMYNSKTCYELLFNATSESILTLASDKKWLGAKVGITSILHTWGSTMEYHPHIHSIVTGGGLANNNWIQTKKAYIFKVQVLSSLFKKKFLAMLKEAKLEFPDDMQYLKCPSKFNKFIEPLYSKDWITYIEPPKGSPENIVEYIGRYPNRVAISNERIYNISNGNVTFEYKDYKDNGNIKLITISAEEFIRRFLMHVLPNHFTKIRHYGLLSNRFKKANISLCRILIRTIINSDFTINLTRKLKEFVCPTCGSKSFTYAYSYINSYRS